MNACDLARKRLADAHQALADAIDGDPENPVVASRILTGAPTLEELQAEVAAASLAVDEACVGEGPSE